MVDLVSSVDIADMLSVSEETARKMLNSGRFGPPIQIGVGDFRKHLRVFRSQVCAYLNDPQVSSYIHDQNQLELDL